MRILVRKLLIHQELILAAGRLNLEFRQKPPKVILLVKATCQPYR